jgi:hypothetical protein
MSSGQDKAVICPNTAPEHMVRYGLPASLLAQTDEAEDPQLPGERSLDDISEDIDNVACTATIDVVQRAPAEAAHQTPPAPRHVRAHRNPALASGSAADLQTQAQAAVAAWEGPGRATSPKRSPPLDVSTVTIPQPAACAARRHPPPRFPSQTSCPHRHPFSSPEAAPTAQQEDSPHPATPLPGVKGHRCTQEVPRHSHRLHEHKSRRPACRHRTYIDPHLHRSSSCRFISPSTAFQLSPASHYTMTPPRSGYTVELQRRAITYQLTPGAFNLECTDSHVTRNASQWHHARRICPPCHPTACI